MKCLKDVAMLKSTILVFLMIMALPLALSCDVYSTKQVDLSQYPDAQMITQHYFDAVQTRRYDTLAQLYLPMGSGVSQIEWQTLIESSREELGALISYELRSIKVKNSLTTNGNHEDIIIAYMSRYEKRSTEETFVLRYFGTNIGWKITKYSLWSKTSKNT